MAKTTVAFVFFFVIIMTTSAQKSGDGSGYYDESSGQSDATRLLTRVQETLNFTKPPEFAARWIPCPPSYVKAADRATCLYEMLVCDGKRDYPSGFDEDKDFCEKYTCPRLKTKVNKTICYKTLLLCNGWKDSRTGFDEDRNFCQKYTCPKETTKVNNKTCIKTSHLCNGARLHYLLGMNEDKKFCETFECPSPMKKCGAEKGVRDYPQCKYSCSPPPSWSGSNRGRWAPHFLPALSSKWKSSIMREHFGGNVRKAQVPAVDKKTAATLEEIRQYMQAAKRKAQSSNQ